MAYPLRKMSDGNINAPAGDRAIFNGFDTIITRSPKIPQAIEPSPSKPVKQPNVSAQVLYSWPPDKRESFEAES
jgi:hypothetical protein